MNEKYTLDMLTRDSVSVKKQQYVIMDDKNIQSGNRGGVHT